MKRLLKFLARLDLAIYVNILDDVLTKKIAKIEDEVKAYRRTKLKNLGIKIVRILTDDNPNNTQQLNTFIDSAAELTAQEKEVLKNVVKKLNV